MSTSAIKLDNIYVINVKRFTRRRQFIESQLFGQGLDAEFMLDWDPDELGPEVISKYFNGHNLTLPQMSCAIKHVMVLEKITEKAEQQCLVLEDDAKLAPGFIEGLKQALTESINFAGPKVIFIGCGGNHYTPKSARKSGQHLYPSNKGRFTDSYLIDAETAKKRLEWIYKNKISVTIDNQFEKIDKELEIQMLWLEDPVVEQGSKTGLFSTSLSKSWPSWIQSISFAWEKLRRKYIYQLWR